MDFRGDIQTPKHMDVARSHIWKDLKVSLEPRLGCNKENKNSILTGNSCRNSLKEHGVHHNYDDPSHSDVHSHDVHEKDSDSQLLSSSLLWLR